MSAQHCVPTMSYGAVKKGREYRVLEYGYDYTKVSAGGHPFFIPNGVFAPENLLIQERDEENDDRKN